MSAILRSCESSPVSSPGRLRQGWLRKFHLPQHGAAGEAVRVRQRLQKLEMIVGLADDQFGGFSQTLHRRKNVARLALEFRRLAGAVGENERRMQAVEMALGAELLHH